MSSNLLDWQDEVLGVDSSIDYLANVLEARDISMADGRCTLVEIDSLINKLNGIKWMLKNAMIGEN
ncbi:hypothetical protein HOS50_gp063 [Lactobacillus phage Lenus]|jgi:hypothetical protein|uniref:Uncharacterized protein n=1 Tax=Lactobacillus phage Lenus TaxID=2053682 RepID=A0A2H4PBC9_9CAUD|nr:hypothetical protein HOS50_gp063 [Lactobacillus phage Lenus]ATW59480.1 hypothetical protein [Lactobacillus phage Lenus]